MRAASALPTEDRVKNMNYAQWIWYYLNIVKDEDDLGIEDKHKIDYLTFFINPQLAEEINKNKKSGSENIEITEGNSQRNSFFDEELRKALQDAGISDDDFTELPSSDMAGDPNESKDDFLARVMSQQFNEDFNNQTQFSQGIDDEIDYFEYPEDEE